MIKPALLCIVVFATSGCTTSMAMFAMNGFGACSPAEFKVAKHQASALSNIRLGQNIQQVVAQIGTPERIKTLQTQGGTVQVLEYETGAAHCRIAREDIKIIAQNGVVTGLGDADYERLSVAQFDRYPAY